jgi:hypothetical protein
MKPSVAALCTIVIALTHVPAGQPSLAFSMNIAPPPPPN